MRSMPQLYSHGQTNSAQSRKRQWTPKPHPNTTCLPDTACVRADHKCKQEDSTCGEVRVQGPGSRGLGVQV
eukprot:2640315-Rhodomonas_salina.1